ncbi:hypothetical protein BJX96DRAFT_32183 [Aspergillus floccosus]
MVPRDRMAVACLYGKSSALSKITLEERCGCCAKSEVPVRCSIPGGLCWDCILHRHRPVPYGAIAQSTYYSPEMYVVPRVGNASGHELFDVRGLLQYCIVAVRYVKAATSSMGDRFGLGCGSFCPGVRTGGSNAARLGWKSACRRWWRQLLGMT